MCPSGGSLYLTQQPYYAFCESTHSGVQFVVL